MKLDLSGKIIVVILFSLFSLQSSLFGGTFGL